jgi:hypothetical protein
MRNILRRVCNLRKLLLKVGEQIEHKYFGKGDVVKVDPNDMNLRYLIHFEDGSKSWLANWQVQKEVL